MRGARGLIGALALLALGCAAKGPSFSDYDPVFPGEARLYVYRPSTFANQSPISLLLGGKKLATLNNGGYVSVSLPPGDYQIVAEFQMNMAGLQPVGRSFRVRAGQEMFCGYFSSTNVATVQWRMDCSDDREAHAGVGSCKREPLERDMGWQI